MKKLILITLLIVTTNLFAQQQQDSVLLSEIPTIINNAFQQRQDINSLKKQVNNQSFKIKKQNDSFVDLQNENIKQKKTIDSLSNLVNINNQNITTNSEQLGTEIQKVTIETKTQISTLDSTIGKNRLYWIIASLGTLLLGALM